MRPLTQRQYDEVKRYFSNKEWRYLHDIVDNDRRDEPNTRVKRKIDKLFPKGRSWELSEEEESIITTYIEDVGHVECDI